MTQIATLGPAGTFSDLACEKYLSAKALQADVQYYTSIKKTLEAIGTEAPLGVLPIENLSEGFVSVVLDHLIDASLYIVAEVMLPIHFSLVSPFKLDEIDQLYVQFVAAGQCTEFIESLKGVEVVTTQSNIESLQLVSQASGAAAAVVPHHAIAAGEFALHIENINDYPHNQTRFLVFSAKPEAPQQALETQYKTSLVALFRNNDRPGYLERMLHSFTQRGINLTSIVSRPTRQVFGKYHFFIDIDGHVNDPLIASALAEIESIYKVKVFGSYPKAVVS